MTVTDGLTAKTRTVVGYARILAKILPSCQTPSSWKEAWPEGRARSAPSAS